MRFQRSAVLALVAFATLAFVSTTASAKGFKWPTYEVTITNITKSNQFTPILLASHNPSIGFFELGEAASAGLAELAEGGDPSMLAGELTATGKVFDTANSADVLGMPPLLFAGQSVTLEVKALPWKHVLSFAAMILPTNDSFVAIDDVKLPGWGKVRTVFARGYDAGSELNDEFCENVPGPLCGGAGGSPDEDGEGFVHIANGIIGVGDIDAATYDFNNPVAKVTIRRVK